MTTTQSTTSVDAMLARLRTIIDANEELDRQKKELSDERQQIESDLMAFHKTTGLEKFSGSGVSVTFDPTALRATYDPDHWPGILKWAVESGNGYIIQHRLSNAKVIDLFDQGVPLPEGLSLIDDLKIIVRRT